MGVEGRSRLMLGSRQQDLLSGGQSHKERSDYHAHVASSVAGGQVLASTANSLIEILPSLLWIAFAGVLVAVFYKQIRDDVIPRLSSLKLPGGIELALRQRVTAAAARRPGVTLSEKDESGIVKRLERSADVLKGAHILWVDDDPDGNLNEAQILRSLGAWIEFATTSKRGRELLKKAKFDVVISDIDREDREDEGVRFVQQIRGQPPTILYVTKLDRERGTPAHAFAITNRPDQLLHYVLDALDHEGR
jgi:CheY-like chemotaxis protein